MPRKVHISAATDDLPWDQILSDLGRFEGTATHMYLDTKGLVTVGVGKMLSSAAEAQKLPFTVRATNVLAAAAQIAAEYHAVLKQEKGLPWRAYKTTLDLSLVAINQLLQTIAEECDHHLKGDFKGYSNYPVEVRRVLIDMRFNLGGNLGQFKKFKTSVESAGTAKNAKLWEAAAQECNRPDVGDERNLWAHDLLMKAAGIKE